MLQTGHYLNPKYTIIFKINIQQIQILTDTLLDLEMSQLSFQVRAPPIDLNLILNQFNSCSHKMTRQYDACIQNIAQQGIQILLQVYDRYIFQNMQVQLKEVVVTNQQCRPLSFGAYGFSKEASIKGKHLKKQFKQDLLFEDSLQKSKKQQHLGIQESNRLQNDLLIRPLDEPIQKMFLQRQLNTKSVDLDSINDMDDEELTQSAQSAIKEALALAEASDGECNSHLDQGLLTQIRKYNQGCNIELQTLKDFQEYKQPGISNPKFELAAKQKKQQLYFKNGEAYNSSDSENQNQTITTLFKNAMDLNAGQENFPIMNFDDFKPIKQKIDSIHAGPSSWMCPQVKSLPLPGHSASKGQFIAPKIGFTSSIQINSYAPKKTSESKKLFMEVSHNKSAVKRKVWPSKQSILAHNRKFNPDKIFGTCIALNVGLDYFMMDDCSSGEN